LAILLVEKLNQAGSAFDHANKAREFYPNDPEVAKALGIVMYERKDYARSAQLLKESLTKLSKDATVHYFVGLSQHQLKQDKEAAASLKQALALNLDARFAGEAKQLLATLEP